jgi:TolB-like protein/DNA-binding winged helix-turn-helix (wHTH) protein
MADAGDSVLLFEAYALDLTRRVLLRGRRPVELRPKSFDVLAYLARNAGRVVTKDELIAAVWPGVVVTEESLTRCVSDIRAALGDGAQRLVKTVPRCGYVFASPTRGCAAGAQARRRRFSPWVLSAWLALFLVGAVWLALAPQDDTPSLSIVVLPLTSRNGNDEQQYLAEAVTEELTVDLSRIPDSFVIGRSTANTYQGRPVDARRAGSELGVRYVLEGSLDRIGDEVRISLQLVDALSGRAFAWSLLAETYSADVGARTPNPSAAAATRAEWLRLGEQAADRAYALEPNRSTVLGARGFILSLQGRGEEALVMVERHLAVNRNDATAWFRLCYTFATLGRQEEAIKACHEAIRLSPRDPALAGFYVVLAAAHLYLGRDDEALAWARKATSAQPTFAIAHSWAASAAANLGEMETARSALAEFLRQRQDQTITSLRKEGLCANATCERQRERYYAGLAKAGLPG